MYAGEHHRFPGTLRDRLNSNSLRISPMVRLELTYLYEVGKITDPPDRIIGELLTTVGLTEDTQPFSRVIDVAERVSVTRDPFDRIIIAQALAAKNALATKDERILAAYPEQTVWE
ncbi:MAG: PIN domain-containing protein [Micrococcales bacterium]|nr:PIN domain-containing protein [Micrococcales bacterium]